MKPQNKNDLEILFDIGDTIKTICKLYQLDYNFHIDTGSFETRIDIREDGLWAKGDGKIPSFGYTMFCPDLIDFEHQTIIEYEELAKPNTGYLKAKRNKGHFPELLNPRDENRDLYYKVAGFKLLKIWESDINTYQTKLVKFLKEGIEEKVLA